MKTAVVYWSGTGNTQAMAEALVEAIKANGAQVDLFTCDQFSADQVASYDAFALGCPSMGDEVLEDSEFEPMYDAVEPVLSAKRVALFGSYGWGDGQWMRDWEARAIGAGLTLIDTLIVNETPDDEGLQQIAALGKKIVEA